MSQSVQVIRKQSLKYALAATDSFIAEVSDGESFEVETELNIGGHLITHEHEKLELKDVTIPFVNPATGPVRLKGARPGQMVVIDVIEVGVHGLGFTALWPGIGIFPDWVRRKEFGIQNRNVRVEDGMVHWSDTLKLEAKPMVGVIGVAPVAGGMLTIDNGVHGGNMDVQEVTNGNRVMFPVFHEGAYLYFGDVHALQGDAECNGMGAIEIRGHLKLRVSLAPAPKRLTWDNGSPMKGATMLATLQALGVMPSFSRPAVSNDNPFSESLFRTMKYRPTYPTRPFENLLAARQWVGTFVQWYNHEHRHSAIGFVTPDQRHTGLDTALLNQRVQVYEAAKARHPQRWSGATRNWQPVSVVHLNPDQLHTDHNRHKENHRSLKQAA
jgi:amidase